MKTIVILVASLIAAPAWADMYKCTNEEGRPTYSDKPCGRDAVTVRKDKTPARKERIDWDIKRFPTGRAASDKLVNDCLDLYRPKLKDPRSAYASQSSIMKRVSTNQVGDVKEGVELVIDGRAKNSFGGYIPGIFVCDLTDNDELDVDGSRIHVLMFQLGVERKD